MPRHIVTGVIAAGTFAAGRYGTVEDVVGRLRAARNRALGGQRPGNAGGGRYLGDGDVVIVLVDQGAGERVREAVLEAMGASA